MRTLITSFAVLAVFAVTTGTALAGHRVVLIYPNNTPQRSVSAYRTSPTAGVRRDISAAQAELARAYAVANRTNALADDLKAAQAAATQARRDYAAALTAAKENVPLTPELKAVRANVRELEGRLADSHDTEVRLGIATELMAERRSLNAMEADALGIDPDLAVSKTAVAEADHALADVEAKRQKTLSQDPQVLALRQRLDGLRRQLAVRR